MNSSYKELLGEKGSCLERGKLTAASVMMKAALLEHMAISGS